MLSHSPGDARQQIEEPLRVGWRLLDRLLDDGVVRLRLGGRLAAQQGVDLGQSAPRDQDGHEFLVLHVCSFVRGSLGGPFGLHDITVLRLQHSHVVGYDIATPLDLREAILGT